MFWSFLCLPKQWSHLVFPPRPGAGLALRPTVCSGFGPDVLSIPHSPSSSPQIISCRFGALFFASAPAKVCELMFKTLKLREPSEQ